MRLRTVRVKPCYLYVASLAKDNEGNTYQEYAPPVQMFAERWPGSGPVQQAQYGLKLPVIRNFRLRGSYTETITNGKVTYTLTDNETQTTVTAGDGVSLDGGENPTYKINAIYPRSYLELECEPL